MTGIIMYCPTKLISHNQPLRNDYKNFSFLMNNILQVPSRPTLYAKIVPEIADNYFQYAQRRVFRM